MEANESIQRILNGDTEINLESATLIHEHIFYKMERYFGTTYHLNPERTVQWVRTFNKRVREGAIQEIDGSIEHYFWCLKWKRLRMEALKLLNNKSISHLFSDLSWVYCGEIGITHHCNNRVS